jgi:hypothetical protein
VSTHTPIASADFSVHRTKGRKRFEMALLA